VFPTKWFFSQNNLVWRQAMRHLPPQEIRGIAIPVRKMCELFTAK
jgi:hypothetical protein